MKIRTSEIDGRRVSSTRAFARLLSLSRFMRNQLGSIGPLMALLMIPIAGAISLGVEQGGWLYFQRSMQNAADSAALAAATNNSSTGSTYIAEARAAARNFNYIDGVNNTTVGAAVVTCPAGVAAGATCYQATISSVFPLTFSNALGFTGSQVLGNGHGQMISASAVAVAAGGGATAQICVLSLSSTGVTFNSNGGPKPDMAGCSIFSNGGMTCNGHNLGASYGVAVGTNNGCGITTVSNSTAISDPYAARASNIPANNCGSYPQLPAGNLPPSNRISGSKSWTGNQTFCGDVQLSGDVTLTGSSTTLVIHNGRLDLNGYTLSTASGATATVVFSGTNSSSYSHFPMSSKNNSGTLNIQAPTSGAWSGVALYQDPNLTTNVSFTYSGNQPTWNLTGLAYFPKADLTFSGAVNKSANGSSCFVLVSYTVLVNGTANIFANNNQCASAGLSTPSAVVGAGVVREKLVL